MAFNGAGPTNSAVPVTASVNHAEKSDKFNGLYFKRWQQKMLFYLTTLNLARSLTEEVPTLKEGEQNAESVSAVEVWDHSNFLCRNYVLNGLADALYNVFCEKKTAKELVRVRIEENNRNSERRLLYS
ncbi:hypothetical protein F511_34335 [Dorcoceras hygrometricum]|uniref:Uncharacterized protein n=1 Tax=Dorcoceras hygrometricum TaxID=472368 RepID=A0A2Z7AP82_9LAMI|nr:hypothetical protein F511_34335 [Dorcoceras hygrometricum]